MSKFEVRKNAFKLVVRHGVFFFGLRLSESDKSAVKIYSYQLAGWSLQMGGDFYWTPLKNARNIQV